MGGAGRDFHPSIDPGNFGGIHEEMTASRYYSEHRQARKEGLIDHPNPWVRVAAAGAGLLVIAAEAGVEIVRTITEEREKRGE
jgi:hypothetical protein